LEIISRTGISLLPAARGQLPIKRVRLGTTQLQSRMKQLCENRRDSLKTI